MGMMVAFLLQNLSDYYFHIENPCQSVYHYQKDMKEYSCFVLWEERTVRKLVKGDEGWKPQRMATKSLARRDSLTAVAAVELQLIVGCWGRKQRFRRTVPQCEKDSCWCLRSSLPLVRKNWLRRRWEDKVRIFQATSWWNFISKETLDIKFLNELYI